MTAVRKILTQEPCIKLDASKIGYKYINSRRRASYSIQSALGELCDNPLDKVVDAKNVTLHFTLEVNQRGKLLD